MTTKASLSISDLKAKLSHATKRERQIRQMLADPKRSEASKVPLRRALKLQYAAVTLRQRALAGAMREQATPRPDAPMRQDESSEPPECTMVPYVECIGLVDVPLPWASTEAWGSFWTTFLKLPECPQKQVVLTEAQSSWENRKRTIAGGWTPP